MSRLTFLLLRTLSAALVAGSAISLPVAAESLIPVEKFAEIPLAQEVRLSPDGTKVALISYSHGHQILLVHDLGGSGNLTIGLGDYEARWIAWKTPQRLVAGVFSSTDHLFENTRRREDMVTRIFAVDVDGKNLKDIGEPPSGYYSRLGAASLRIHPQIQDEVASLLENDPTNLIQSVVDDVPTQNSTPAIYQVDINSGAHHLLIRPRPHLATYRADQNGVIRLAMGLDGTNLGIQVRDSETDDWRLIHQQNGNGAEIFEPLAFVPDHPTQLLVVAPGPTGGRARLWVFDTRTLTFGDMVDDTIATAPSAEIRAGRLVSYATRDGARKYLDPDWQADYVTVKKLLDGKPVAIVDRLAGGARALFKIDRPTEPASWWILDRTVKPTQFSPLIRTYPEIADAGVSPVKRIVYAARDGLKIASILTLPLQHPDGPIPFVVLPHGGPNACDANLFDYEAQFLASRGWGVLQPEFRGSTCFGPAFEQKGYREWGFKMQDDLTDGTRWLIDQKLADPSKICIVGSSYGGYAALEGVAKEPDLYRCAAAWAPVTDLPLLRTDWSKLANAAFNLDRLGDDQDRLKAASPARHAEAIKVPVLLVHGKTDFTVQVKHSQRMESALKDAGKPVEAIYLDGEDHYRLQYPARLAWLQALDRFLTPILGQPAAALVQR